MIAQRGIFLRNFQQKAWKKEVWISQILNDFFNVQYNWNHIKITQHTWHHHQMALIKMFSRLISKSVFIVYLSKDSWYQIRQIKLFLYLFYNFLPIQTATTSPFSPWIIQNNFSLYSPAFWNFFSLLNCKCRVFIWEMFWKHHQFMRKIFSVSDLKIIKMKIAPQFFFFCSLFDEL